MFDIDSIRWDIVGGDNLPVSVANGINEAKASILLLDLYYKGDIKRYTGESIFRYPHLDCVFKSDIVLEPTAEMVANKLSSFQIMNGIPHFPLLHFVMPKPNNGSYIARYVPSMLSDSFTLFKLFPREKLNGKREMRHYSKIEQSLHFFDADTRPFGSFDLETRRFKLSHLRTTSSPEEGDDLSSLQDNLSDLVKDGYRDSRDFSLIGYRSTPGLITCVDFRDKYGTPNMRLSKGYRLLKNRMHKSYIPTTCWYVKHNNRDTCLITDYVDLTPCEPKLYDSSYFYVPVGFPDGQPLYNLDYLDEAETIVICNSPESAEALQEANDIREKGVAFTGFVCDPGQYDEVDFSPLKGKQVYIEISNHNGLSLAESYLEANKLYEHLRNEVKIENIGFIQREIEYPDMDEVSDLDGLVKTAGENPPTVNKESVLALDEPKFKITLEKAQQEIDRKKRDSSDLPFWGEPQSTESETETNQQNKDSFASLIMRPIINRGKSTLIAGMPYTGKTAFSIAMGGYLSGCDNHFLENWYWTRHNKDPQDEKSEKIEKINYKVVYLLFDSGGEELLDLYRTDFCPGIEKNNPLFITDDLGGNTIDYTKEENYGKFMQILDKYEKDGRKMDVLFIDTAARFAAHDHFDIKQLNQFMSFFNSRRPDVALVFVHHAKSEKEIFGGPLALATVRNGCVLFRTKEQRDAVEGTPTLNEHFTIRVKKSFLSTNLPTDLADFTACTVNNEFTAVATELQKATRLRAIVDMYLKRGFTRPKIASLLDCSTKTLFNHLKEADELIKGKTNSLAQDADKYVDEDDEKNRGS